ncbi:MAG: valine--tRNA ligase [Bacillota bacterium]|jgi:valyl-tRNA synthetase|nr:valine--tRNA ligase [Bacillota bacterium]HOC06091.1 valine--tRNA ligase [Bacillota bacterium]HPZ21602.1 valine--tRNA ligase [Bacillota bacterium]HQD19458.1 valine--tRNA ligase [Bacillota bacterium]
MEKDRNTAYNPGEIEPRIRQLWQGKFTAPDAPEGETFSIVMPPPNVTGALHMGHALDCTLQDVLVRWKRMEGYACLWLPGTDHAGIATQIKVEEKLRQEGLSRHDLGREEFVAQVWKWKEKYHARIVAQMEEMGISCDWSRERFTLDEGCSRAVREVFVRLYEKGLIYRGEYIVNWCPRCQTALSDIEVEHEEAQSHLWHLKYPLADGSGHVVVATTRPETMLGDTAVAVNPGDERYAALVGREIRLPISQRLVPIIADDFVDPQFGTGAVKVTPAHDPNDYEMGLRHNLPQVRVIDTQGRMTEAAGKYAGMDRYQCRQALVADLESQGALVNTEDYTHATGHCQRCATVVEPLVSRQWFVKMKPLAAPAIEAVRRGDTVFVPRRFERIYFNWLENIRDWCISRQLWWGHRIPAWYCQCGETIVAREDPSCCPKCGGELIQDPDVLDTWFSSALWPFSTMGWPEETEDYRHYFPTSVLVTGYDIIFFWVARMIFSSLEFTGQTPFKDVYIHGLVRDELGRKMSKSLDNGIDPLEIIAEYGADTLRFSLLTGAAPGNDIRFQQDRVEASRNFANKIWNAARFVLMNLEDGNLALDYQALDIPSLWVMAKYNAAIEAVTQNLEKYELGEAARTIYEFLWNEFCDWYIEAAKLGLAGEEEQRRMTQAVLKKVLAGSLQLLHPIMPYITEEIWQQLEEGSIALSRWPKAEGTYDGSQFELVMELVWAVRNIRSELNISPGKKIPAWLSVAADKGYGQLAPLVCHLARASEFKVIVQEEKPKEAVSRTLSFGELLVPLQGVIDIAQEIRRLERERERLEGEVRRLEQKLANPGFTGKAPKAVVDGEREKLADYLSQREQVAGRLAQLKAADQDA